MRRLVLAGLILATTALPAAAQDMVPPEAEADMTCLCAYLFSAGEASPDQAVLHTVGAMFYLGRLEGRDPDADWVARIPAFADRTTLEQINAAAPACAAVLRERGAQMVALSAAEAAN